MSLAIHTLGWAGVYPECCNMHVLKPGQLLISTANRLLSKEVPQTAHGMMCLSFSGSIAARTRLHALGVRYT